MIKICFYSHTIDYAGTWRSHEKIFENINREIFDPYIMYWDECKYNNRLEILKNKFGSDRFIPFKRSVDKTGPELGYTPKNNNFKEIVIENMGNMDVSLSADKYDNFCEVNRGTGKKLEESCNNLTKENCNKVSCCVHINGSKCVAGSKNGATYRTEKNGDKISVDYYYYKNKCAGNCPK